MIRVRTMKEFYCIMDLLLMSTNSEVEYAVDLTFSGMIVRGDVDCFEKIAVPESLCKITMAVRDEQLRVVSSTNKKIIDWVSQNNGKSYRNVCSYMSFLDDFDTMCIERIMRNDEDVTEKFNNDGVISLYGLMKFCVDNTPYKNVRVNISDGIKPITFVFIDDVFTRFVKYNGKNTLYVNKGETVDKRFRGHTIVDIMYSNGIPDITSQIGMYKSMSDATDMEFNYIVN